MNIQVLQQSEICGHSFNVYGTPEEPLFWAKEVADIIEHSDVSTMLRVLDESDKMQMTNPNNVCGGQKTWFLTEDGLYEVLMQSRKPIAKQFKKGVKEILKSIRKTGGYIATTKEDTPEEIMAKALIVAQETIKKSTQRIENLEQENKHQAQQLQEAAPKVSYVDNVLQSVNTYTVQQIAKELDTTAIKLYQWLASMKIMFKQSGVWMLSARYNGLGYTKTRTHTFTRNDGSLGTSCYTVFTEKGRQFIHSQF